MAEIAYRRRLKQRAEQVRQAVARKVADQNLRLVLWEILGLIEDCADKFSEIEHDLDAVYEAVYQKLLD